VLFVYDLLHGAEIRRATGVFERLERPGMPFRSTGEAAERVGLTCALLSVLEGIHCDVGPVAAGCSI
jgi:hypothetical protein